MSARTEILSAIRASLGVTGPDLARKNAVAARLADHPAGIIPARGQLDEAGRAALFKKMAQASLASVVEVSSLADVPAAAADFLTRNNLPAYLRRGGDPLLSCLNWGQASLRVDVGPSNGQELASISHAFAAVAETGTLVLVSGLDNPTTLNFLPDNHIVVVELKDIVGDYESVFVRLRAQYPNSPMPRAINMITGPSRSADIAQTMLLGAHGPRKLHIVLAR